MKIALFAAVSLVSCTSIVNDSPSEPAVIKKLEDSFGPWENAYKGDPGLAGVILNRFTEGMKRRSRYINKHPASIWYVFWNGDVTCILYEPDGSIMRQDKWKGFCKPGVWFWDEVDFSYGSDPNFKRHEDPRKSKIDKPLIN